MQGRFKRDGSAAGDPELRGATDRGSSAQRAREGRPAVVHDADGGASSKGQSDGSADSAVGPKEPSGPGSRLALRNWRISTRLVSLLALPVVAATTLGAFRIVDARGEVEQLENMKLLTEMTQQATELAAALQEERDRSAGPLTAHGNAKDDTVVGPREKTDKAKQSFNEATGDLTAGGDELLVGVQSTIIDIGRQLNTIKNIRERAYENPAAIAETVGEYNRLIVSLLSLSQDMAQATSNPEMVRSTRALAAFSTAKEYASIQRAVISAGLAPKSGPKLSENDRRYGKIALDNERAAMSRFNVIYQSDRAAELTKPLDGGIVNITSANEYASRVFKSPDGIKAEKRSYMDWYDQDRTKIDEMAKIEKTLLTQMEQQARELRSESQQAALFNGAVILLVLGISLVGAFVVARSMVSSLRRLQDTAQEVSRRRLPELVKQLSESEPQEVDTTVQSVGVHSRDEIGKVATAFDDVHREAVRLASEQALLRGNVNAMFTNLSRRSQGLIQRQLSLISELESREADPDQLSSLFKLDHLATRMRRNGENLLVLAGEEPGRRWTRPVPLVDVLRAAASEVEQYERIELSAVPTTEVAGRVVNDLVHLLAELLENATSFSSPQTKVKVTGHALPDGRVLVEIHDTGIGLSPEDLAAINERLANPPTVDVSVSRRMGLFVVGRLSLRHGIRIQLRPSDSGGTTALVMLPVDVAQSGQGVKGKPGAGMGAPGGAPPAAATLKREPQGSGAPSGTSRLGALPTRGQVPSGDQRPALPGADRGGPGGFGGPGGPGAPSGPGVNGRGPGAGPPPRHGAGAPSAPPPSPTLPAPTPPAPAPAPTGTAGGRPPQLPARDSEPVGELPPREPSPGPPAPTGNRAGSQRPSWAGASGRPAPEQRDREGADTPRGHEEPESTGEFARPGFTGASSGAPARAPRQDIPQQPQHSDTGEYPQPSVPARLDDTTELDRPVAPGNADSARTPIFEEMETSWFSARSSRNQQQPERSQQPEPSAAPSAAPAGPSGSAGSPRAAEETRSAGNWQASPNDERWRRAEQLRQPAAGGVTTSGLPRRVPRANLVAGTAQTAPQQSTTPSGPQVSRAPGDVRGRLTNLRRGIQQGRQAGDPGSNDRGSGPTYQQER
ncbi:nitrate- and nitrite sensing domain-containing protein [Streptomyces gobiensis]|uniref:sensor histidine kinase n=1 Tax=Streptomyces gobiensis TaxID=2875706 RepID=UPI001E45782D|nr:nitrate- and nitrite sensing domain-containing protein [Streptomyces gobiensis]UGY93784.1 nitrate- and nitrite sensing domain-containing protein [Streptomyces gobiensis]